MRGKRDDESFKYASTPKPPFLPEPNRCAFPGCQAGGVILPGAPRFQRVGLVTGVQLSTYHPGCWAALGRRQDGPA